MREICDYKNNHPDMFASEIGDVFKLSTQVIRKYLKRGTKLNLCQYEPRNEAKRVNAFRRFRSIPVYIENMDTWEHWEFAARKDFYEHSKDILDGDEMTKGKLEKMFKNTKENYVIYDSGEHDFLICVSRRY